MRLLPSFNWQDGWTALMFAAQNGHTKVVKTSLQHGAKVDMQEEASTGKFTSSAAGSGLSYVIAYVDLYIV